MKKTLKKILCAILVITIFASLTGCAKIDYVFTNGIMKAINEIKSGEWNKTDDATNGNTDSADVSVLETSFTAGTYGGVDFNSIEDVADYYVQAYNYTKSLTADYIDADGNKQTFYKLLGDEKLEVGKVVIDGSENKMLNNMIPGILDSLFDANIYGLVPCYNRDPKLDNNFDDETKKNDHDFRKSGVTADDILDANITDNGDGTITMVIQPKEGNMSFRGDDSQGRFFEVLGDINGAISAIDIASFESGTADENVLVNYKGGTVTVKIDTATKEIIEADYFMIANLAVKHINISVIKDKNLSATLTYTNHYPASDDYLMESRGIKRV